MRLSKEELITKIKSYIGDDTSDAAISILEDVADSVDVPDGISEEEMNAKIEEIDKKWREKYIQRFTDGEPSEEDEKEEEEEEIILPDDDKKEEIIKYDDLFEEKKEEE